MPVNFEFFTDKDKENMSYGACVAGATLVGAGVGRFLGLQGLLAGAGTGLVYGLIICKNLKTPIKNKIFSSNQKLTDTELSHAITVIREQTGVQSKSNALYLLGIARNEFNAQPLKFSSIGSAPMNINAASALILKNKGKISA